jgi:hypothetical protein
MTLAPKRLGCLLLVCVVLMPGRLPAQTDFSAGGFLKLHGIQGDLQDIPGLRGDQELFIPHVPVSPGATSTTSATNFHARTSRLWLRASRQTDHIGKIEVMVEGDLFGDFDGYRPRVRHAYLVAGPLLVGQTWSTFINTSALADIDSGTAVGNMVTRQHQLRWTGDINQQWQWHLALESPLNRLHYSGSNTIVAYHYESRPDIAARLQTSQGWGNVSVSLLSRELSADAPWRGVQGSTRTLAFSVAGRIDTGALDNLRFMLNHGDGLARHATLGTYADAVVDSQNGIEPVATTSALLAWQHYWTPQWRSTFGWSRSLSRLPETASKGLTVNADSLHFNLVWAPGTRYSLGAEYLHAARQLGDSRSGDINRVQLTYRLNF